MYKKTLALISIFIISTSLAAALALTIDFSSERQKNLIEYNNDEYTTDELINAVDENLVDENEEIEIGEMI